MQDKTVGLLMDDRTAGSGPAQPAAATSVTSSGKPPPKKFLCLYHSTWYVILFIVILALVGIIAGVSVKSAHSDGDNSSQSSTLNCPSGTFQSGSQCVAGRSVTMENKCAYPIWIGAQGNPLPEQGGFMVAAQSSHVTILPTDASAIRFWARTQCTTNTAGHLQCLTGDCPLPASMYSATSTGVQCKGIGGLPPTTLAEFTFGGTGQDDFYDISWVDGYNIPMSIRPDGNFSRSPSASTKYNCGSPVCSSFNWATCPPELLLTQSDGSPLACMSICAAINNAAQRAKFPILQNYWTATDATTGFPMSELLCCACGAGGGCNDPKSHFCCSPYSQDPNALGGKCAENRWPLASNGLTYPNVFKSQCPDAYSWQFDDLSSTYQCQKANYIVSFC